MLLQLLQLKVNKKKGTKKVGMQGVRELLRDLLNGDYTSFRVKKCHHFQGGGRRWLFIFNVFGHKKQIVFRDFMNLNK